MAQISPTAPRRAPIQKSLPKKRSTSRSVELNPRVHHGHDQVGKDVAQDKEEGGYGQGSHDHRLISAQKSLILQKPKPLNIENGLDEDAPADQDGNQLSEGGGDGNKRIAEGMLEKRRFGMTRLWRPPS